MTARYRTLIVIAVLVLVATGCSTSVFDLEVGLCFNDPDSFEEISNVETVACEQEHDNEVFAVEDIAGGANWPGGDLVADAADDACIAAFEGYVGIDYFSSVFELGWLAPTPSSWADGDREVICFLYDPAIEPIRGSAKGSGA